MWPQSNPVLSLLVPGTLACSRVAYNSGGDDNRIVVGRTMDWLTPLNQSLFVFPPGLERDGSAGNNSLSWTTKYGSVVTAAYNVAVCDGMNSQGLVANTLYLADGSYGPRNVSKPAISLGVWSQYYLDNYATVQEAADDLYDENGQDRFQVRTANLIPGVPSLMHVSLTDRSGDNLILEYLNGTLVSHHGRQYNVMTNEPDFDQQLAISEYWAPISNYSLPGTDRPADRFARLAHYVSVVPDSVDQVSALSATAGMARAVSVPLEPININTPNICPTLWRTYADTKDLWYFFESATDGAFLWVDLTRLSFNATMTLAMLGVAWTELVGDMTESFKPAAPFKWLLTDT